MTKQQALRYAQQNISPAARCVVAAVPSGNVVGHSARWHQSAREWQIWDGKTLLGRGDGWRIALLDAMKSLGKPVNYFDIA